MCAVRVWQTIALLEGNAEHAKNTIRELEKRQLAAASDAGSKKALGEPASPPPPPPPPQQHQLAMPLPAAVPAGGALLPQVAGAAQVAAGGVAKAADAVGKDNKRKEQPGLGLGEEALPAKKYKAHAR